MKKGYWLTSLTAE